MRIKARFLRARVSAPAPQGHQIKLVIYEFKTSENAPKRRFYRTQLTLGINNLRPSKKHTSKKTPLHVQFCQKRVYF